MTTPTAPTPEELAKKLRAGCIYRPHPYGAGYSDVVSERDTGAAMQEAADLIASQAAQIAELTAECERHASDNLNVALGWRMMLAQAEGDLAEARADLSASQERERVMREVLTGMADVLERDCGVQPCAASMAPAERYLGIARNLLATL
jgi:multidrug resistance efflux pump